ncbi:MAG: GNAT family N-acetyltransferase [Thermoanaerobaculia bacterium]
MSSGNDKGFSIASSPADYAVARQLFEEYAERLGVDLCFQGFAKELEDLQEKYGPPAGCILLARDGGEAVGCIALRRVSDETCEMKRLYVRSSARGTGLGRRLAIALIDFAGQLGYRRMILDTLATMTEAHRLYASLGFTDTAAYYPNPLPGVRYMALDLLQSVLPESSI